MGAYEGVNRLGEGIDAVLGLISSRREFIIKQIANAFLLFIILIVFGCLDFATLKFHAEYLATASYWGTIGTKLIAAVCALNVGINMMLDNEIKKSEELRRNIKNYNHLILLKDTDFEYFVEKVFNKQLKIDAYKNNINAKIYRLNKYARRKDKLLYSSNLPENEDKKLKNRYCIKRAELEALKSDEYIEQNIDSLYVKYKEVDPKVFELETNGAKKTTGVKVTGNITFGRFKESSSIILSMLALSMLTTSFGLSASKEIFESKLIEFWHYTLKALEDAGIVLWQFFNGMLRTRIIVSSQLTQPYAGRNMVLLKYLDWRGETKAQESPSFKELNKEEEEEGEILELTEEQFKQLSQ